MRVIENSPLRNPDGKITIYNRILGTLRYGTSWYTDMSTQQMLAGAMSRILDDKFYLILNVPLPEVETVVPMIVVGPTGVRVIHGSGLKGIYRAKGDGWWVMDQSAHRFRPAQPNIISRVMLMARAVATYLAKKEFTLPEVEAVVMFSDTGIHVDTAGPDARVVTVDGLERYVTSLMKARNILQEKDVIGILRLLAKPEVLEQDEHLVRRIDVLYEAADYDRSAYKRDVLADRPPGDYTDDQNYGETGPFGEFVDPFAGAGSGYAREFGGNTDLGFDDAVSFESFRDVDEPGSKENGTAVTQRKADIIILTLPIWGGVRLAFSTRQWMVLGLIFIMEILIWTILVFLVVLTV